jgi:hypothetical protein
MNLSLGIDFPYRDSFLVLSCECKSYLEYSENSVNEAQDLLPVIKQVVVKELQVLSRLI